MNQVRGNGMVRRLNVLICIDKKASCNKIAERSAMPVDTYTLIPSYFIIKDKRKARIIFGQFYYDKRDVVMGATS